MADHFVLWEPRDVVGGDIYWAGSWGQGFLLILGDCTGHGVPGAFMTLISMGALERARSEVGEGDVGGLLTCMHEHMQVTLGQHAEGGESDDGIELGACYMPNGGEEMIFVGARFSLFVVDGGIVSEVKGTKKGMGYRGIAPTQMYECHQIGLKPDRSFYMTSDGYLDQIGGEFRRMFGKKRSKELLLSMEGKPMGDQSAILMDALIDYQGDERRRDDVTLIGFKV
jgi:serine phosphatase RsbU (regulator of sigma subunit)